MGFPLKTIKLTPATVQNYVANMSKKYPLLASSFSNRGQRFLTQPLKFGLGDEATGYLIGAPIAAGRGIMPTHVLTQSPRATFELTRELAEAEHPTVFAVTPELARMLRRQNYLTTGTIEQPWGGSMVTKEVLVSPNPAYEEIPYAIRKHSSSHIYPEQASTRAIGGRYGAEDAGISLKEKGGLLKRIEIGKSGIHIKEKNKGKFTASAKRAGMSVQEYAHKVMNDPEATPLQKKRANFAIQAKKWK